MQIKQRLDSLTSLRFFAAAMIVIHHTISYGLFGLSEPQGQASKWGQGVSFFFVLSGFILAYVYPKLETWPEIRRFLLARIARVWPALAFSFIFALWLLSLDWDSPIALANVLMINAWIPYPNYFFSYISPSWSVSTEFFFYLTFPFLIYKWDNNRFAKLLISFLILLIMLAVSNMLQTKTLGDFENSFAKTGLLYISPVTRIFEFIFGMFIASVWKKITE
ncbi:Acyltransferase 3 (fragment) [Candidatus Accumulibacter aalborgensis]|uniref:Acyltransferase 3 n=1 Tax=Candidatus Accumulibacter aalborgensis TaxID=1860102 RepID=A0A1A8XF86_9PROT